LPRLGVLALQALLQFIDLLREIARAIGEIARFLLRIRFCAASRAFAIESAFARSSFEIVLRFLP
jgi:hypothetical protein